MKKIIYFVIPAIMTMAGCKQQPAEPVSAEDNDITSAFEGATDTVMAMELTPVDEMQPAPKPRRAPAAAVAMSPKPKAQPETIYVETDGAQGRVWGHVTMTGDKGTGTIHDWNENTLTVNVTRQGNELFAVDQNSRQYIFRLRK